MRRNNHLKTALNSVTYKYSYNRFAFYSNSIKTFEFYVVAVRFQLSMFIWNTMNN